MDEPHVTNDLPQAIGSVDLVAAISGMARVYTSPQVMYRQIGDEGVLLDMASATYFGLNAVGAKFWALILVNPEFASATSSLLCEFEVSSQVLERDLVTLVRELAREGLVTIE